MENQDRDRAERRETRRNQTFQAFLTYLRRVGSLPEDRAEHAAVSVLCALERRIRPEEARDLEAQLPAKLRELVSRCDRHAGVPPQQVNRETFTAMVADDLGTSPAETDHLIRVVFHALRAQVSEGEARQVESQLPADLRELWQSAFRPA